MLNKMYKQLLKKFVRFLNKKYKLGLIERSELWCPSVPTIQVIQHRYQTLRIKGELRVDERFANRGGGTIQQELIKQASREMETKLNQNPKYFDIKSERINAYTTEHQIEFYLSIKE